jgi:nucleoside-diphosphate-sugar epimerase
MTILGAGFEISIRDLVAKVSKLSGFKGEIDFGAIKPDAQSRRRLDPSRVERYFGFRASEGFEEGLKKRRDGAREAFQKAGSAIRENGGGGTDQEFKDLA